MQLVSLTRPLFLGQRGYCGAVLVHNKAYFIIVSVFGGVYFTERKRNASTGSECLHSYISKTISYLHTIINIIVQVLNKK